MRRKRLVLATTLGLLLAFLPATVSAHGGLHEELDPQILGPTLALGLALFVSIFRFMLTGPAWLFGLPEEPVDDDRVIALQDVRTRRQRGYRRGQEERREEERPWRGRSAG